MLAMAGRPQRSAGAGGGVEGREPDEIRCKVSEVQSSKPTDRLASLRIDRNARPRQRSSWFGTIVKVSLILGVAAAAGYWTWQQYGEAFLRPQVKVGSVEARVPGDADSVLSAQGAASSWCGSGIFSGRVP